MSYTLEEKHNKKSVLELFIQVILVVVFLTFLFYIIFF
jgi:hypothetical protein